MLLIKNIQSSLQSVCEFIQYVSIQLAEVVINHRKIITDIKTINITCKELTRKVEQLERILQDHDECLYPMPMPEFTNPPRPKWATGLGSWVYPIASRIPIVKSYIE